MAIFHLSQGVINRKSGRSSVQNAAYITGEKLHESLRYLDVNYPNRHSDVAFTATLEPEYAPVKFNNLGVWDFVETFEEGYGNKHYKTVETREAYLYSARTAQTIVVALPHELELKVAKELVEEFALSRGLVVTYAIHGKEGNPHAYLQISSRAVDAEGAFAWTKDRAICSSAEFLITRNFWADLAIQYLEREGVAERITEKFFTNSGTPLTPSKGLGSRFHSQKKNNATSRQ